ncbi:Asp-tRNA(Asn)/Glu-tRNA(Gln) amidotransferase subunit GatB [Pseudomonadota bacterium]
MKTNKLNPVIGIEIHVELATLSKMFCGCPADHFGKPPNSQTCPVCLALPGALPVPNKKAIDWTIMIGLALGSKINHQSKFDRKHYFYPDLPKGYQISQYDQPFCTGGEINTVSKAVGITRVHLEEDTGKLQHKKLNNQSVSLVDFNRSGVPLVEIVSEPDITSSTQAKEYAKNLARTIRFLGVSDADMDKGSMRLEANISWGMNLGYKVEVKNINSFNYLAKAIDYELKRQLEMLKKGKTPVQETRGYNENKGVTFSQRSKEEAQDYRYFPEPDIPPIEFSSSDIESIRSKLPQLPTHLREVWKKTYHLNNQYYDVLLANPTIANYTTTALKLAVKQKIDPNKIAGTIVNKKIDITKTPPQKLIEKLTKDSSKVSDSGQIEQWVTQAIKDNPKAVKDFKAGKDTALKFLMGQVMKLSRGQADAQSAQKLLTTTLSKL